MEILSVHSVDPYQSNSRMGWDCFFLSLLMWLTRVFSAILLLDITAFIMAHFFCAFWPSHILHFPCYTIPSTMQPRLWQSDSSWQKTHLSLGEVALLSQAKTDLLQKLEKVKIRQSDRCGSSFRKKFSVSQFCQETKQGKESLTSLEELKSQWKS